MKKEKSSKKWDRPRLIVLVRGKSQEAVLSMCKCPNLYGSCTSGPEASGTWCALIVPSSCVGGCEVATDS